MAQRLARHSDINLTMGVHTRLGTGDLAGAVNTLPDLRLGSRSTTAEPPAPSEPAVADPQDADLRRVVAFWPRLSDPIRKAILALLAAAEPNALAP